MELPNSDKEYRLVAQKYKGQADAIKRIADKIINGGSGAWGDIAMAAHPQIKQADAEVIADYILSLADVKPRLATEGEFVAVVPEVIREKVCTCCVPLTKTVASWICLHRHQNRSMCCAILP